MSTPIDGITGVTSAGITGIKNPIQQIAAPVRPGQEEQQETILDGVKDSAFGSIFTSLIQDVKDTDAEFTQAQYLLATGQLENPAQVNIAAYKNQVAVDLLVELRNRALEAYNELKNMSV